MSGLITFYKNRLSTLRSDDHNLQILRSCLLEEDLDEPSTLFVLEKSKWCSIESPYDFLNCLRTLSAVLIVNELTGSSSKEINRQAKGAYKNIISKGFWKEFQLGDSLSYLITHYLDSSHHPTKPENPSRRDYLLEIGDHVLDGGVPHTQLGAELALIRICLGYARKDDKLIASGIRISYLLMSLFDHKGDPLLGIWLQESAFSPAYFFAIYSLLFSVTAKLYPDPKMSALSETLLKNLEKFSLKCLSDNEYFIPILASFFQRECSKRLFDTIEGDFSCVKMDRSLGFLRYEYEKLSLACSASGVNTGLGSLHKESLEIVSFGPHFSPLADSDRFGIYRTCSGSEEGFKDLLLEHFKESCRFKGWSRLVSPEPLGEVNQNFTSANPGKHWVSFDIQANKDEVTFDISFSSGDKPLPLFFVFFVRAQKAFISKRDQLLPGDLNQFHGQTCPVIFENKNKQLSIKPIFDSKMILIPLESKQHFWSATFLLAFPIKEALKNYCWNVK